MPLRFNLLLCTRSRVTGAAINSCVNQLETLINKQELRSTRTSFHSQTHWTSIPTHFRFDCLVTLSSPPSSASRGGGSRIRAVIGRRASSLRLSRSVSGGGGCQSVPGCCRDSREREMSEAEQLPRFSSTSGVQQPAWPQLPPAPTPCSAPVP